MIQEVRSLIQMFWLSKYFRDLSPDEHGAISVWQLIIFPDLYNNMYEYYEHTILNNIQF